jgi:uncharacterized protein with ATP-grasp and redox domains
MEHLSLPSPLMVSDPGSFAEFTIVRRKPEIIRDIVAARIFPEDIVAGLRALADEIATGIVAPLHEDVPDVATWHVAWQPWEGKTWRQLPWYFAESYFYRRVLEITGYFQHKGWNHVDPFAQQKYQALAYGMADMISIIKFVPADLSPAERVALWLQRSLWGNRADLSNREVLAQTRQPDDAKQPRLLLVDHTAKVVEMLASGKVRRLVIVTDNCGLEFFADLFLADELLSQQLVQAVILHVKPQPFFVSDLTFEDAAAAITALQGAPDERMRAKQAHLDECARGGRMRLTTHPFWATSGFFSQMPEDLMASLDQADLVILKGDVSYRRLIEDRHWPPTADLGAIAAYMPTSFLALRTLKSEVIVGLEEGVAEATAKKDPKWLINGQRGVVHLVVK